MSLSYSILSEGAGEWVFAFYGYGQQASVFRPLSAKLKGRYNVLVIDLPYEELPEAISKQAFTTFLQELIHKFNIRKVTCISYSMGSRFNLVMAECLPSFISKMILVAPDGIRIRLWTKIATKTWIGKGIFCFLVHSENAYLNIVTLLYRLRLMPSSMYAFTKWHMRDKPNRLKVYHSWMNMRKLSPDLEGINRNKTAFHFDLIAWFGKDDKVINLQCMKRLAARIPSTKIIVLEKGHGLLSKELLEEIGELML